MKKVILFWQYILTNKLTIGRRKLKKKKETQGKLNNVIKTWKIKYIKNNHFSYKIVCVVLIWKLMLKILNSTKKSEN